MDEIIKDFIVNAEKLAALSAGTIWALFTLGLISYIAWDLRNKKKAEEERLQMRLKDAESDILMSKAFEKIADEIKDFKRVIKCIGGKE